MTDFLYCFKTVTNIRHLTKYLNERLVKWLNMGTHRSKKILPAVFYCSYYTVYYVYFVSMLLMLVRQFPTDVIYLLSNKCKDNNVSCLVL